MFLVLNISYSLIICYVFLINTIILCESTTKFKNNFFSNWNCIGIKQNIDFSKPHKINIGELPLVLWRNPITNQYITTVNICNHMGAALDTGKITLDGCLKCSYHGLEFSHSDGFGETIEHEGKLFWAYKPIKTKPYRVPFFGNPNYENTFMEFDMDCSLPDSAYNTMDLRHPEYVHNKGVGFGSSVPPSNVKHYVYEMTKSVGLAFDYESNNIIKSINDNFRKTYNFNMFKYPTFSWSKVSFSNKDLIISVNFLPLSEKKTRWYITICHNYYTTELEKVFLRMLTMVILKQDFEQLKTQYPENELKQSVLFQQTFKDEEPILELQKMFRFYIYPTISDCVEIYNDYKENR